MDTTDLSYNNYRKIKLASKIIAAQYKGPDTRYNSLRLILAGGALRDLDCGKEIKDLDFFTNAPLDTLTITMKNTLQDAGIPASCELVEKELSIGDDYKHPLIYKVYLLKVDDIEVNFIVTRCPPVHFVNVGFDFGICKIYLDENNKWVRSHAYCKDAFNKCITYIPTESNAHSRWHSLNRHLPRLLEKYPEYEYRGPLS